MTKILITTSRRPTTTTRRFVKSLSMILPASLKIARGKLTLDLLALQALDLGLKKILIVRNKKGNPGYIDVYVLDESKLILNKVCTLYICGYSVNRNKLKIHMHKPVENIIVYFNVLSSINDIDMIECLLTGFNAKVIVDKNTIQTNEMTTIVMDIKKMLNRLGNIYYEITFKNTAGESQGLVIRVCRARICTKL